MLGKNGPLIIAAVGTGTTLTGIIAYCLWRGWRSGVMVVPSTKSATVAKFSRNKSPLAYWLVFLFWLQLIPIIIWVLIEHVENLLQK